MAQVSNFLEGGCNCGTVRYRLTRHPIIVHCCHCRWCQRESGAAFALNALIESDCLFLAGDDLDVVDTPSESGKGQKIVRCPICRIALWSHYAGGGDDLSFVRVGTLNYPDLLRPDVHIFTESKQPWVALAPGIPVFKKYYKPAEQMSEENLARYQATRTQS